MFMLLSKLEKILMTQENITQGGKLVLSQPLTVFVSPQGSDETGLGTEEKPFASVDYAVVWANINCEFSEQQDLIIQVASGTYDAVQIYGQSARQVFIIGNAENPGTVQFRVLKEEAEYALSISYYSYVHLLGVDVSSVFVTNFSFLSMANCWLNPVQSGDSILLGVSNHSTVDFVSGMVKQGRIGGDDFGGNCFDCEMQSLLQVGSVDYEADVECDTFCDATFGSSIYLTYNSPTKNNVKARRAARAVTQSIVCDSEYLPSCPEPSLASSGGIIDDLDNSELTID